MDKQQMKALVCQAIDQAGETIAAYAESVMKEPELGYKEVKTAAKTAALFKDLGLPVEEGLAITGVRATLKGNGGPTIAILGELDAIGCPEAEFADPTTGAAHACGHNHQLAAMMAAAAGLSALYKTENLSGNVVFFAVPAEEYVELEYRNGLRKEGKLHFLGGKQELIYRGAFNDIDMAMMIHSNSFSPKPSIFIGESSNGFIGKTVRYIGKMSHAAAAPHEGINALNAAMLGLMGIHAIRETFRDQDIVRVHPIITKGGDLVNSVPSDVRIETYVRAKTMAAIGETHEKVDRALKAGGDAVGAQTEIVTMPGYLPLTCSVEMNKIFIENTKTACPEVEVNDSGHFGASTDAGDLSHIIPLIHPFVGGVDGTLHGKDFKLIDFASACLMPAKAMAMSVIDLLCDDAALAKKIQKEFKPVFTREEYIATLEKYFS